MLKNKIKNKMKLAILLIANLCVAGLVQAAESMTFEAMLEKTITTNPEVQARYHNLLQTGFEKDAIRGGFFPKADLVSRYRKQEDVSGNYSAQSRSGFANPRFNAELVISQMLFDGFAISNEVKRLDHNKKQAYYDLQSAMQNTALEFTIAYLDLLRYRELTEQAKNNYVYHRQAYEKIDKRVQAGVAKKVDLEQAAGRYALAEANLLVETTNLHDVSARMQRIYGELPPDSLEPPTFHNNGVEATPEEALKLAYFQNPDLLSSIEAIEANKNAIKTRKASYLPRFDLQARKNISHSRNGRFNQITADAIELTMNYNLFNGFSDKSRILQTAEQLNNTKDLRDKACRDVRQTVVIAYNDIRQLKESLKYRLAHKEAVANAREAYIKQFDIGQRTLLDLLDTQNEHFEANRAYINAQYNLHNAFARTYAGQGELLKKVGVSRDDLPEVKRDEYLDSENVCNAQAPMQPRVDKDALVLSAAPIHPIEPVEIPVAKKSLAKSAPVACSVEDVTTTVKDWATAGAQKNVANFMYFYADDFQPADGLSRPAWESKKRKQLSKKGKTQLTIDNIRASCDGDKGTAEFDLKSVTTTYKLKKVSDTSCEVCNMKRIAKRGPTKTVPKRLDMKLVNGQWKITDEKPL